MGWVEYDRNRPPLPGKYIVKTRTMCNNVNRIDVVFTGKKWGCTNQVVTHYLNETMDREEIIKMLQTKLRGAEIDQDLDYEVYTQGRIDLLEELLVEIDTKSAGI